MTKKNKQKIVKTPFGTVFSNLNSGQKKVLDQLLFSTTTDSTTVVGRQLPQNDIKKDHLLIKGFELKKNMTTGSWELAVIDTNQGRFGTGEDQTSRLDQKLIRSVATYLKQFIEEDLQTFIEQENKE
jgi:hypothetical protein